MDKYIWLIIWLAILLTVCIGPLVVIFRTTKIRALPVSAPKKPNYDLSDAKRASQSLSKAITFQTVAYSEVTERDNFQFLNLKKYLREQYPLIHEKLECDLVSGFSLLYRWASPNPQGDPILLCGHLDVVPATGEWEKPPFSGAVDDGYVWGRGALDCKNVVICIMEAVESLLSNGVEPSRDIYLAFGHDEETGGTDGAKNIAKMFSHRGLRFNMVLDEGGALTDGTVPIGRPVAEIGVAEKGFMNLRITARGSSGHASRPPEHTALGILSEALCRIEFKPRPSRLTPLVKDNLMALSPWLDHKYRLYLANLWLFKRRLLKLLASDPYTAALIRTTIAPTMSNCGVAPNVLPEISEAMLNIRLLTGDNDKLLLAWLDALTKDLDIQADIVDYEPPSRISEYSGEAFEQLTGSIRDVFHKDTPITTTLMCGGSDARNYEPFSDAVYRFSPFILSPADVQTIHDRNERVSVASLGAAVAFYKRLITRLCLDNTSGSFSLHLTESNSNPDESADLAE